VAVFALLVGLAVVGALYQVVSTRRHGQRHRLPGRLIDVGGHRLHAVCQGEGKPIVLLESGIAASSLSWTLVQPEIAKFTHVCAYDRAGLAWSDLASSPRTFARIVEELRAVLMDVAPRGPYVLVGHSFGSFVVRAYAAHFPRDVAGVVLVDPHTAVT
jgi:pimeloyl-ACP methyl ester carboxylesterase